MKDTYQLKIDAYAHIVPPKYKDLLYKVNPGEVDTKITGNRALYDLEHRFRIMDLYEPLRQVLTLAWPPIEAVADPQKAAELARDANNEMAELVAKYPERFCGAIAILPMNNMDAVMKEAERAIKELRMRGVYVHSPVQDKPLDLPEFEPLYEMMCRFDLPIFIHPMRMADHPDYRTETESKYLINSTFGWPYETTAAMTRLVFSGVMEKYPGLKVVTHHCGGLVPFYEERIIEFAHVYEKALVRQKKEPLPLTKPVIDYYKMFYADTAIYGNPVALMCGLNFFGADHLLFGADFPLGDTEGGPRNLRKTINAVEQMTISDEDRKNIYEDNPRRLMRLTT
jgi:predicted TIM-barrel fold metal-dependent hydrolase